MHIRRYQVFFDLLYDRRFDNSKLLSVIGDYKFTDTREGLRRCVEAFLKEPEFPWLSASEEGIHDYYAHELTPLSCFTGVKQKLLYVLYRFAPVIVAKIILYYKRIKDQ